MPGDLTPTEQRILEGLASGLYDAEIAVRLGLPVGDLKQRIAAILQRQHLVDREALLAWYRGEVVAAVLAPNDPPTNRRRWYVGVGVSAAIGALLAAYLLLPGGDGPPAFAGPTLPPQPTLTPTPAGPPPELVVGEPVPLDPGYAVTLIAFSRTPDGDQVAPIGFDRIYLDPAGPSTILREPMWRVPPGATFDANWTINNEGTRIAAVYLDGAGQRWMQIQLSSGAFSEPISLERNEFPVLFAGAKVVLSSVGKWEYLDPENPHQRTSIDRPDGTGDSPVGWSPDTGLLWPASSNDRYFSGELVPSRGTIPRLQVSYGELVPSSYHKFVTADAAPDYLSFADLGLVAWYADQLVSRPRLEGRLLSIVRLATGERVATYQGEFWPVGVATEGRFTGMYCEGACALAVLRGFGPEISLVEGLPVEDELPLAVVATQRGPLARVRQSIGPCTPLLTSLIPKIVATACIVPGALLTLAGPADGASNDSVVPSAEVVGGTTYVRVLTLDGEPAWVERAAIDLHIAGVD